MPGPLYTFALAVVCFLLGHAVILGAFALAGLVDLRARAPGRGALRYLVEFVAAEALMLTAAIELGVVRLSRFSAVGTLVTLAAGFAWWELWFYLGHRLMHTRALYAIHRPHHASAGLHPSLCFGALETVALSSGFYLPLALASHRFGAVSVETLALVFAGAYALNVVSHLDVARLAATRWRFMLGPARRHARHHAGARGDYGLNSACFDRLFGTALAAPRQDPVGTLSAS